MCSMNTRKSIFFSQTSVRIQLYKQLGYNTYLKLLRLPLLGGQPSRLTNSFVEYYRFDSLMSQLFKSLGYNMYLKLLRLPLSSGQPSRLTKSFIGYYRTNSSCDRMRCLHNLSYVILFFVICFTDGIFDDFNGWNHCIF